MYAKPLTLIFNNQEVTVELGTSIKKEDLYGKKSTSVEINSQVLEKVLVTPLGEVIRASATSVVKDDGSGSPLEATLTYSAENGQLSAYLSSFKEPRILESATKEEAATMCAESVYPVAQHSLEEGFYKTKFAYRDSPKLQDAILIASGVGPSFLVVGEARQPALIGQTEGYEFFDAEDENDSSDELSFDMF